MSRTERLTAYLAQVSPEPWKWGTSDCTMMVCDWVRLETGVDPAERYRGVYTNEDEAQALHRKDGGFVFIVREEFERVGLVETAGPQTGDVGIVDAPLRMSGRLPVCGAVLAVRLGSFWAVRAMRGVRASELPTIRAWALGGDY
jgi:hypothetical protein